LKVVIDTNVLVCANRAAGSFESAVAARYLFSVMDEHRLVEDDLGLVYSEYKRHVSASGQPGAGDAFFKWYMNSRWTPEQVLRVPIDPNVSISSYVPTSLQSFDNDDHKWIAIYLEGGADEIANCSDSDWINAAAVLISEGIVVNELCLGLMSKGG
jgi:hypothetical protein